METFPQDVSQLLVNHGVLIYMPFDGSPKQLNDEMVDPLEELEYGVSFTGEGGMDQFTNIKIGRKIWFDGSLINGE